MLRTEYFMNLVHWKIDLGAYINGHHTPHSLPSHTIPVSDAKKEQQTNVLGLVTYRKYKWLS